MMYPLSDFELQLLHMKQLYLSTERQFLEFNEIIPYTSNHPDNWNKIHSPMLVNIVLSACPQIEKMLKILSNELKLKPENEGKSIFDYLKPLDKKGLLKEQFVGMSNLGNPNILLQPFLKDSNSKLEWWYGYNQIKHDIIEGVRFGTLKNTINALAGLSILHHIAYALKTLKIGGSPINFDEEFLDSSKWRFDEEQGLFTENGKVLPNEIPVFFSSKVFFFCTHRFTMV